MPGVLTLFARIVTDVIALVAFTMVCEFEWRTAKVLDLLFIDTTVLKSPTISDDTTKWIGRIYLQSPTKLQVEYNPICVGNGADPGAPPFMGAGDGQNLPVGLVRDACLQFQVGMASIMHNNLELEHREIMVGLFGGACILYAVWLFLAVVRWWKFRTNKILWSIINWTGGAAVGLLLPYAALLSSYRSAYIATILNQISQTHPYVIVPVDECKVLCWAIIGTALIATLSFNLTGICNCLVMVDRGDQEEEILARGASINSALLQLINSPSGALARALSPTAPAAV